MVKEVRGGRRHIVILCRQATYIKSNYLFYYFIAYAVGALATFTIYKLLN